MIVDLLPTEDQQLVSDSIESFLRDALPVDRLRDDAGFGGGPERAVWADLAGLGLFGLGLAAERGGVGYGAPEEITVSRLFGRNLVSPAVIATMAAVHVAAEAGDGDLTAALASGEKRAAFANLRTPGGEAWEVQLIDAEGADLLLLLEADRAHLIPAAAARDVTEVEAIDQTVQLQRASIDRGAAVAGVRGEAVPQRVSLMISAYLAGASEAARDMAVEYAKVREQFGQPIGAFQAVKHMCAEMALRSEAAHTQAFYATLVFTTGSADAGYEVACARSLAGRAAVENGKANVQVHGGMGFTQEANAHHYLKRAFVLSAINSTRRGEQHRIMADVQG
ncbi:acyl-CoA dehydrogenase family protein [Phenylobacterium sp.]|jgi:alkylation response protein AidB-like acyl-CoA dehydrogenase|uniref:acyl-CoA dehydrogenase family protein n=1 Tax=Phenylobacterium sp. TaxID=1871053 RepID=UPI002F3E9D26